MNLERYILQVIRKEKKAPWLLPILAFLSFAYRSGVALRNWAYSANYFKLKELNVPVVSIGNLIAGGTGKTPLTQMLASFLQDKMQLAILSRGYKSQIDQSRQVKKISHGQGPLFSVEECGDEPYFLAQKTKACVWVGGDRVASGGLAIKDGAECLLLDDGFQHRRLKRDFDIVIVDAEDPISQGRFLPWGLLRDSPRRLRNAGLIVASHLKNEGQYEEVLQQLAYFSVAPVVGVKVEVLRKETFIARKVGVFCGIGQPERFLQTVRDLNQEIVETFIVNDHASLSEKELTAFARRCEKKGAKVLLCTEKDFVKISFNHPLCLEILPVEIQLKIVAGKEHWDRFVEKILDRVIK